MFIRGCASVGPSVEHVRTGVLLVMVRSGDPTLTTPHVHIAVSGVWAPAEGWADHLLLDSGSELSFVGGAGPG